MKNINKFALAAIAVISVAMILSTGITAAKQVSAKSPLLRVRAARALGAGNSANNSEVCALEAKGAPCTNCELCTTLECEGCGVQNVPVNTPVCAEYDEACAVNDDIGCCTKCDVCTQCTPCITVIPKHCPVQASPGIEYVINSF